MAKLVCKACQAIMYNQRDHRNHIKNCYPAHGLNKKGEVRGVKKS